MALRDYTVHELGDQLDRKLTLPASGGKVGDPGLVGTRPGILLIDQLADGRATVKFNGSHRFRMQAVNNAGNSAIVEGDSLYYDPTPGTTGGVANPFINKDATNGTFFGYAATAVAAGVISTGVVDFR